MATFEDVLRAETKELQGVRERTPKGTRLPGKTVGVAFSGGGIRSATFHLGVLQELAEYGLLKQVDYLSTVSGGGYIGSWLGRWIREIFIGDRREVIFIRCLAKQPGAARGHHVDRVPLRKVGPAFGYDFGRLQIELDERAAPSEGLDPRARPGGDVRASVEHPRDRRRRHAGLQRDLCDGRRGRTVGRSGHRNAHWLQL